MNNLKLTLLACAAASAIAGGAAAQSNTPPNLPGPQQNGQASTSVANGAAPAQSATTIEEVVVTANRRSENLQNVPVSVTAINATALAASGVQNIQDLSSVVAGLQVQQNDGFINTRLRGVGTSLLGPGLESPIALYVDGVYYASTTASLVDFVNVSDVQVLKGPQGTLFGRNATGGLIQITTRTPTQDFHLDTDVGYGDYDTSKFDAYVSGGILPKLAADLAVQVSHQGDGYGKNLATGEDIYKSDFDGTVRSKWVYSPTAGTKITAAADYNSTRNSDNPLSLEPGTQVVPTSATYTLSNPRDTSANTQPLIYNRGGGLSVRLDQNLSFARLSDTVAYRMSQTRLDFDLDFTPQNLEAAFFLIRDHQFSEELQLQAEPSSRIKWQAGIYYFDAQGKYSPGSIVTLVPPSAIGIIGEEVTQSAAGYAQATTEVLPQTNLTVGVRYTYEHRGLDAAQTGFNLVPGLPIATLAEVQTSKNFYRPTFRVALDHRFSPETLAYLSFNTGFKSGGFNTQVPTDPAFAPEFLKAYELGIKNDLFDRRVRADVSVFYYDYTNIQEQFLTQISSGIENGPPAKIYGLDLDVQARVTSDFRLGGQLEYLHARFDGSSPLLPISVPQGAVMPVPGSVDGNTLPVSPEAVVDLTADYVLSLFGGKADANVTYQYNTGWDAEPDNVIKQPPFSNVNLSVHWKSDDAHYTAAVYMNNATDNLVQSAGSTQSTGVHDVQYTPPRTFGFTVGYHY